MFIINKKIFMSGSIACLLLLSMLLLPSLSQAASCCGGGGGGGPTLAKDDKYKLDASFDYEGYTGEYLPDGTWKEETNDIFQLRLNLSGGKRLARDWQAGVLVPFVYNRVDAGPGKVSTSYGIGDIAVAVRYELWDDVGYFPRLIVDRTDWLPSVLLGLGITLPTGISPFDDVASSYDITGRGYYIITPSLSLTKSLNYLNGFTLSAGFSYGKALERWVTREYGRSVDAYKRKVGDRISWNMGVAYKIGTHLTDEWWWRTIPSGISIGYAGFNEGEQKIRGVELKDSGIKKNSFTFGLAWMWNVNWLSRFSFGWVPEYDDVGRNFPTTNTISFGVSYIK